TDPFKENQRRLEKLFDGASTPDSSEETFVDDVEYGSDKDYRPSESESSISKDPVGS
ncbi:unnamed protein product, partial [Parnassius apollo]